MSAVNDGGPAFPVPLRSGEIWDGMGQCDGMTLRDYFAAKAMQSSIEKAPHGTWFGADHAETNDTYAAASYAMADAMLKARAA